MVSVSQFVLSELLLVVRQIDCHHRHSQPQQLDFPFEAKSDCLRMAVIIGDKSNNINTNVLKIDFSSHYVKAWD